MENTTSVEPTIGNWNEFSEEIQQTASRLIQSVNSSNRIKNYNKIVIDIVANKSILEPIFFEASINLYQALLIDALLHWYDGIMNALSENNANKPKLLNLFKELVTVVNTHKQSVNNLQKGIPRYNDFSNFKSYVESNYNWFLHLEHINGDKDGSKLQRILDSLEKNRNLLEFQPEELSSSLTPYQRLILVVLEKACLLKQSLKENESVDNRAISIEWLSSKFERYADLFEQVSSDQLPFDYNKAKYFFKVRNELIILARQLELAHNLEEIDVVINLFEEIRVKYYFDVEEPNNELLYNHNLLLNSILNKAIDIYNENSENYTIEESLDLLNKLLENFTLTKLSVPQGNIKEEWDEASSGYHRLRSLVADNYYFLQLTKILSSESPDLNSVKSLSEETEDPFEIEIDEDRFNNIISLYRIRVVKNINDLEETLSYIDGCKPVLDKYVINTGLRIYPILIVSAIGRFINIDIDDISSNNRFLKQLARYTQSFQSFDTELFPADMQPFFAELKNYGAIVSINEIVLDKLTEQLRSSEITVHEAGITYNGEVDLAILSDQIAIFKILIFSYDLFPSDVKKIFNNSLKRIVLISAGSFEQVLASKHDVVLNSVIQVLFFINSHLQGNPIEDFDSHLAMKICGHFTHSLYYFREGDNENTISTESWLILAKDVLNSIEKNGIENYRIVINYEGDLYRNLKAIYTIQPPREQYISDDSNSITYQLYQKVSEIITLKSEFAVGATASLEERQKNIPLRALACMVKGDPSHLTNVETILVELTGGAQLNHMKMVLGALKMSSSWDRIISIVENERLIHLKHANEVIFSYICAKINLGKILTEDEIKYYSETSSDLESIFLAEVFINIGDYNNALLQIDKINLAALDQNAIKYALRLMDRLCHTYLYNKDTRDSKLFHKDSIEAIEKIYLKFKQIELTSFDCGAQMQYRLLKLYLYCNNEAKINELISTLSIKEEIREYQDIITKYGKLNEIHKSNLFNFLRCCQHELTLEDATNAMALFQELADAAIENDQITHNKHNEIIIASKDLVSIEERLLAEALTTPTTQLKSDITVDAKTKKDIIKSIDEMLDFREDEGETSGYRRDFPQLQGKASWSKCEIQKNGSKQNKKGKVQKTTVAQVNYETSNLIEDAAHLKIMKIALKISLEAQQTIQIASGTWEHLVEIANDEDKLRQHFIRLTQTKNAGDISALSLRETEIEYWLNYNELALTSLLDLRLRSEIDDEKQINTIYILETIKFDFLNQFAQIKLVSLSERTFNIYTSRSEIKTILIPILISKSITVNHWVGMVLEQNENNISITYLDSENQPALEIIEKQLVVQLSQIFSGIDVLFKQPKLEAQKYNNCGLELIENFVYFLSEKRVSQGVAPYIHSELYVQNIMLEYYEQGFREATKDYLAEPEIIKDVIKSGFHSVSDNNYISTLTIIYQSESSCEYETWFSLLNYLGNVDLIWKFKKWLYSKDVVTFDQIMQKYNIARSIDELKDTKLSFCSFFIELKDKELAKEVLFVAQLNEKLNLPIGTKEIEYLQPIIYKTNMWFKVFDTIVDTIRLIYAPTTDNTKKVLIDSTFLYSMYFGVNGFSVIINGVDVAYKVYQSEYNQAFTQTIATAGYMFIPVAISFVATPYFGFVCVASLTINSGYSVITNAYSLYQEYNSIEWQLKSGIAYKDASEFLTNSPLQQIYDFAASSKYYKIKINAISLEIEKDQIKQHLEIKGEFGNKLYDYIYIPMLEEKYTLLNKIINGELTKEQAEASKAQHVSITIENQYYQHCIEIVKLKDNEIEHYYCYNEEQQILDHVLIGKSKVYAEVIERF